MRACVRAYLVYEGNKDHSLPFLLLAIEVSLEVMRVVLNYGGVVADHQVLKNEKKKNPTNFVFIIANICVNARDCVCGGECSSRCGALTLYAWGSSSLLAAGRTASSCWKGMKGFSRSKVSASPDTFRMSDKNGA